MQIEKQSSQDLARLGELIKPMPVAMMTTHAEQGGLVSRPLQTLMLDANGELIFFTSADSAKVAQLTENSQVNLSYADPDELSFVSVRGRARMDRDEATIERLWSVTQKVFFPLGKDDPTLMVLRVRVEDASAWHGDDSMVERILDIARGLASDQPRDLGTQEHLGGS